MGRRRQVEADSGSVVDVVVLGGGPAGCSAALVLGREGHCVLLLTSAGGTRRGLAESVPPSAGKLFSELGILERVESAGFFPGTGNTVLWAGDEVRQRPFPAGTGWQVERRALEEVLQAAAQEAGVQVRRGARVQDVRSEAEPGPDGHNGVRVRFRERTGGWKEVRARLVLDASGRAGVMATSRGLRKPVADDLRTTALVGLWEAEEEVWGLPDEGHTLVESFTDGWAWSIPVNRRLRYFTAMIDPRLSPPTKGEGLEGWYEGALGKAREMDSIRKRGRKVGGVWVWGATPYRARAVRGEGFLLLGDAAVFLDPLTSYGVKKALASGWLGGVVAHTALRDPARRELAMAFFQEREEMVTDTYVEGTRRFYRQGLTAYSHPFWETRAEAGAKAPTESDAGSTFPSPLEDREWDPTLAAVGPDAQELRSDPEVLQAFHRLREATRTRFEVGRGLDWVRGAAVRGGEVVPEWRIRTRRFPGGLRYLRNVDSVRLVRMAPGRSIPQLLQRYEAACGPVPLPDFLGTVSVLLAEGVLVNTASGRGGSDGVEARAWIGAVSGGESS